VPKVESEVPAATEEVKKEKRQRKPKAEPKVVEESKEVRAPIH
jgi:hypothetical protein